MNTDEARGIWGVSCYQIAAASISVNAAMTPVISLPVERGAALGIQKAVVNVMEFPARGRHSWNCEADSPQQ